MKFNPGIVSKEEYKIGQLQQQFKALIDQGEDVINCSIGDPLDDTPTAVSQALIDSLTSRSFSQYPPYIGSFELRNAISTSLGDDYGVSFDADHNVIACNGTKEAIFSLPLFLTGR